MPGQIYQGIQSYDTWSNILTNTNLQYMVKFTQEYKPAIPGQITKE